MYRVVVLLLCAWIPLRALGSCADDSAQIKLALPPEALAIRAALLTQLCADGDVVDVTDPTMQGRLTEPKGIVGPSDYWNPVGLRGKLLVAYVVDIHGSIQHPTALTKSGDRGLDEILARSWRTAKYKTPAMLDGKPVRVLMYFQFKSIVNGH